MLTRFVYFAAFLACIFIPLLIGGGLGIFSDKRAQIAAAFGLAWATVESSIHPSQFAQRGSDRVWVAAVIIGITGAFTVAVFEYIHNPELTNLAESVLMLGLSMMVAGLIVRYLAIRTLGEFFNHELKISQNHRIIQNGLYHHMRHPSYTGFALICLGISLAFGSIQVFAMLFVSIAIALTLRILSEEQVLLDYFGDDYRAYQKRTKRLIPFVW